VLTALVVDDYRTWKVHRLTRTMSAPEVECRRNGSHVAGVIAWPTSGKTEVRERRGSCWSRFAELVIAPGQRPLRRAQQEIVERKRMEESLEAQRGSQQSHPEANPDS